MKLRVRVQLQPLPAQAQRLADLQGMFSEACNQLAPIAAQSRCWNRVALHHLAYKSLREAFPDLGSQMVCNAIFSVCRACRLVYQHPESPFNVSRLGNEPLPTLRFTPKAPVYFDRHTLSIKNGQVSMFTLGGRIRFGIELTPELEARFRSEKLREIVLTSKGEQFSLTFDFAEAEPESDEVSAKRSALDESFKTLSDHVLIAALPGRTGPANTIAVPTTPPHP